MVLVFLVFLVFSILGHFAKTEQVECPVHKALIDPRSAKFAPNIVYAVRVCVTLNWPIQNCKRASESVVKLTLGSGTLTVSIQNKFTPVQRYCYIFDPCAIADALRAAEVTENIQMSASAEVYTFDKDPDPKSKSLDIQIAYNFYYTSTLGTYQLEHEFLSVICPYQNCAVQSEGYGGDRRYYFALRKNQAPECVVKGEHSLSVHTFLCDPRCSRNYTALDSSVDAPSRPRPPPVLPPPLTGDTGTKGTVPPGKKPAVPSDTEPEKKPDTKAPAAATTTKKSNAVPHLSIGTIFTVAVLALLA